MTDAFIESLSLLLELSWFPILTSPLFACSCVVMALLLDRVFGEPRAFHPIVGLGNLVRLVEGSAYKESSKRSQLVRGFIGVAFVHLSALSILFCVFFLFAMTLEPSQLVMSLPAVSVVYIAIAPRSLLTHIEAIEQSLISKELDRARAALALVVSRDTQTLQEQPIAKAAIESLTENENDGVIAPIFWFLVFGPIGVVVFKVANTLDSMWGYRNLQYKYFGRLAARMDDVLGFIPARITALCFTRSLTEYTNAMKNARVWYSPNAGPVMAAGANALGISLGGKAVYEGSEKPRPVLGIGREPSVRDLTRCLSMVRSIHLALLLCFMSLGFVSSLMYLGDLL